MLSHGLPQRFGQHQHESLLQHAAPCSFYQVHASNEDKIPCFISGYKVCLFDGHEKDGLVLLKPEIRHMKLQRTEAASGVSSTKPCCVPIDAMHKDVTKESFGVAAPHLVRVKCLCVIDEYGAVARREYGGGEFLQEGQDVFLFPGGFLHSSTQRERSKAPQSGLLISGLYGGQTAILEPLMGRAGLLRGVPVLNPYTGDHVATAWV